MLVIRVEDFTEDVIAKRKDDESTLTNLIKKGIKADTQIMKFIDLHDTTTLNRPMIEALVSDIRDLKRTYRRAMNEKELVAFEKLEELCAIALSTPFQYLIFESR